MTSKLKLILLLLITILGCARAVPVGSSVSKDVWEALESKVTYDALSTCEGYPSKETCKNGDSTLFNGLLCLSQPGQEDTHKACESVRKSVDSNGRIWRAPNKVGMEGEDTASRDQFLGVMAYLVKTKDKDTRDRVYNYLDKNTFKLCPTASDNRCQLTPAMLGLFHFVWKTVEPTGATPLPLLAGNIGDDTSIISLAELSPLGYQLHLVAVQLFIRQKTGYYSDKVHLATITLNRRQPDNPFFRYLQEGSSNRVAALALKALGDTYTPHGDSTQWTWERDTAEKAAINSMGWDFVFILNLLEKGK